MANTNQFLPFACGGGANTITQSAYSSHTDRTIGHQPGVALSELENTVLRQLSTAVTALAQFAADYGAHNVLDDATPANFEVAFKSAIDALMLAAIAAHPTPAGCIVIFPTIFAPTGYLAADGSAVSRTTYATLFAVIGTDFGAGNGTTTFNLPDLRGEFVRGWDNARGLDFGRVFGTTQTDDFKSHTHDMGSEAGGSGNWATPVDSSGTDETQLGNPTQPTGGTETRPHNIALLYCIKT